MALVCRWKVYSFQARNPVFEEVRAVPPLKCSTFSKRYFAATLGPFTLSMSGLASYDH